jgi:hypothetical protein
VPVLVLSAPPVLPSPVPVLPSSPHADANANETNAEWTIE